PGRDASTAASGLRVSCMTSSGMARTASPSPIIDTAWPPRKARSPSDSCARRSIGFIICRVPAPVNASWSHPVRTGARSAGLTEPALTDVGREVLAGEGGAGGDDVGGRALEDDPAAVVTGAGAQVDDPVGVRHDRLVVLDDDDRLAGFDEPVEQAEQLFDVGEVEAGGRLVEDVDAAVGGHGGSQL